MDENTDMASELLHYTTVGGLQGILEKKVLWATRTDFLNDKEEREWFYKTRLKELVLAANRKASAALPDITDENLASVTLQLRDGIIRIADVYVASLCHATEKDPDHGLLSQWRGYGTDGGYAVVFDEGGLYKVCGREKNAYTYNVLAIDDVVYSGSGGPVELSPQHCAYEEALIDSFNGQSNHLPPTALESFTLLSALHKHHGFREEKEVRIVAAPLTNNSTKFMPDLALRPINRKPVKFRQKGGLLIPYIELSLLAEDEIMLPIKRIIVGPHPDVERREKSLKALLVEIGQRHIEVVQSGIPFVG